MKLKGKSKTMEGMLKIVQKEGRIGVKSVEDIRKLVNEDKLLEAYFSIIHRLQYQLQANFHNKFHVDWKRIHQKKPQEKDIKKLWEQFTEKVDNFSTLILISYSTSLIDKILFDKLNELRALRNQIAHNLTYYEPEYFITRKEVKDSTEKGIKVLSELERISLEIVYPKTKLKEAD